MTALSGQTTVTAAGTAVALGSQAVNAALAIKALPGNTGLVYVGRDDDGDVAAGSGFPLDKGEAITLGFVGNLSSIRVDAATNGDKVAWLILNA